MVNCYEADSTEIIGIYGSQSATKHWADVASRLSFENAELKRKLGAIETWLTVACKSGLISRGKYAELMGIDRCDVDERTENEKTD